ncbi:hypothetical protein HDU86_008520 [Geranomyces michiganensis]|nr:hypothetical protein HDU86_008520 [Geranomyces michiganensis]
MTVAADAPPLPPIPPGQQKKILIVLIHGFLGSEESFFSFPASLLNDLHSRLGFPAGRIETRMFPRYDTRGHNARSVQKLIDWLLVYATTGRYESVILMAHSMGGLLAADAYQYMYALHKEKIEERLDGQSAAAAAAAATPAPAPAPDPAPAQPTAKPGNSALTDKHAEATTGIEGELAKLDLSLKQAVTKEEERDAAVMADVAAALNAAAAETVTTAPPAKLTASGDGLSDSSQPAKVEDSAGKVPSSAPAASSLSALSSWFGSWRGVSAGGAGKPAPADASPSASTGTNPAADEDGFEGTSANSPDSDLRLLVNIRGIITFDSPFYGLHANVITQAGTNKAVAIVSEGIFNARAYLPAAVETVSAYAPKTIVVPTGLAGVRAVPIPTSWVVDAAKRVVGTSATPTASPTPNQNNASSAEQTTAGVPQSEEAEDVTPTPTTALAVISATPPAPTFASRVPNWVGYALGGAAVAATAYTIAPLAAAYIPASMIASSVATSFAISGAEQIRDHLHFLYPLVNSQWDMHARVCMLRREMEARKRLTFIGFYLDLPPLAGAAAAAAKAAKAAHAKEEERAERERRVRREWERQQRQHQPIQMMDLDSESPLEELMSMSTPYAAAAAAPSPAPAPASTASNGDKGGESRTPPPPVPPRPASASSAAGPQTCLVGTAEAAGAALATSSPTLLPASSSSSLPPTDSPSHPSKQQPSPLPKSQSSPQPPASPSPPPSPPPRTRNFCNLPPADTAHLFRPVTHPHENEIDAHMNLFNQDCGREWYDDLVRRTADAVQEVLRTEARRGKDGVLLEE